MVEAEGALEIRVLHRHGKGIREIARETGTSRNTVRRYLRDESVTRYKQRPTRATKLDPFKAYIIERLGAAAGTDPGEICPGRSVGSGPVFFGWTPHPATEASATTRASLSNR